jgi:AcrR family transcriptional regulator
VTKGQETKASILDDALQIASTVGFTGLTIGQLATHTEMSKSGLYAHFNSKEQLQLQTLDHARERFTDAVVRPTLAAPRGEPRVRELFTRWLDWETDALDGGCIFVTGSVEYDDQPGPMRDALVRNQRDWTELIATVATTAVTEGDFRADVDARQFAFTLQSLILGYHHAGRLLHDPEAREHVQAAFGQLLATSRPD